MTEFYVAPDQLETLAVKQDAAAASADTPTVEHSSVC